MNQWSGNTLAREKADVKAVTGSMSFTIPMHTSPGRSQFGPSLSLTYDSRAGSGPFGQGWQLSVDSISRKTTKRIPLYDDGFDNTKVCVISSATEDLVPNTTNRSGAAAVDERLVESFLVRRYRLRTESATPPMSIEKWTSVDDRSDVHWRTISSDSTTTVFGRTNNSRILDHEIPNNSRRIFSWLICETYDTKGNHIVFTYKFEDASGVALDIACKQFRDEAVRGRQRYLKSIKYGNRKPNRDLVTWLLLENEQNNWMFKVVFDYGEYSISSPTTQEATVSGFEVRTYRLCRWVLRFHHLPERLGGRQDCLVSSTAFEYDESPGGSLLKSCTPWGHVPTGVSDYTSQSRPPMEFEYSTIPELSTLQAIQVDTADLMGLPGVTSRQTQWLDLDGEGTPGLLIQLEGGGWYYQRNESPVATGALSGTAFGPAKQLGAMPSAAQGKLGANCFFEDVDGNGRLDFICVGTTENTCGYYERVEDDGWTNFVLFPSVPSIDILGSLSTTKRIDLTVAGHADILQLAGKVNDDLVWFPSLAGNGFGPERRTQRDRNGPRCLVGNEGQSGVYVADVSGDSLAGVVQVRNGDICYWPNMGHGKFGNKDQFSHNRVRMADVDGSGFTAFLYLPPAGGVVSEGHFISAFPAMDYLSSVEAFDLLGQGTACLCWTSAHAAAESGPAGSMSYINFMGGQKPQLLTKYSNRLEGEMTISYTPSTKFYLQDEPRGKPWKTRLPLPVQCVERKTTRDTIAQVSFTSRYAYHDGYYDGVEREFRGFGLVEQWDAEDIRFSTATGTRSAFLQPPVRTKSWFHTGAFLENENAALPNHAFPVESRELLPASKIPTTTVDGEGLREAYRALKGMPIRHEVFGDDGSANAALPYQVTEQNYEVGNTTKSAVVNYGHTNSLLFDPRDISKQEAVIITCSEFDYTNAIDTEDDCFCTPAPSESRVYRIGGVGKGSKRFDFETLTTDNYAFFRDATDVSSDEWEEMTTSGNVAKTKALLFRSRTYYSRADQQGRLPKGRLEKYSTGDQSYELVVTSNQLSENLVRGTEKLIPVSELRETMQKTGGYEDLDSNNQWWIPSSRTLFMGPTVTEGSHELQAARRNFYIPVREINPFGNASHHQYDEYNLLIVRITDCLQDVVAFENNYAALQPTMIEDCNGNRKCSTFDASGLLVGIAVMGKATGPIEGNSLDSFILVLTDDQLEHFLEDLSGAFTKELLGDAGSGKICDYGRYKHKKSKDSTILPIFEAEITRDVHANSQHPETTQIAVKITYLSGSGEPIQEATLDVHGAGESTQWRFTGWVIKDNKGYPVKQFHPFYAPSHDFRFQFEENLKSIAPAVTFLRDPLNRVIGTLHPDYTWDKVQYTPWSQIVFYTGDTVLIDDPAKDEDVDAYFRALDPASYLPTWYSQRQTRWDKDAARKSETYSDTPSLVHLDPLARTIVAITADNSPIKQTERFEFDVWGNRTSTRDSQDRLENPDGPQLMITKTVYGEAQPDAVLQNLRGRVHQIFDQSGVSTNQKFDFKGNCTQSTTQFAVEYKQVLDWSSAAAVPPALEGVTYTQSVQFDAINREFKATAPHGSITLRNYHVNDSPEELKTYISRMSYTANSLPSVVEYGNGAITHYNYDRHTLNLANRRTWRQDDGTVLEALTNSYGCVERITHTVDSAQQDVYFRNNKIQPSRDFTYNALGQLTEARGREQFDGGHGGGRGLTPYSSSSSQQQGVPGDGNQLCEYTETYTYDEAGNILTMRHAASDDAAVSGWTRTYHYEEPSLLESAASVRSNRLSKTTHGCMTSMLGYSQMARDFLDRLRSTAKQVVRNWGTPESTWYVYDFFGKRVRKITEPATPEPTGSESSTAAAMLKDTWYLLSCEIFRRYTGDGTTVKLEKITSQVTDAADHVPIVLIEFHSTLNMHLNLELDDQGGVSSYEEYSPFNATTYRACSGEIEAPSAYQFASYRQDLETGLYHCGLRYYAPWLGRWTSPDPLGDVDGPNLFVYVNNDSVNFDDHGGSMMRGKQGKEEEEKPQTNLATTTTATTTVATATASTTSATLSQSGGATSTASSSAGVSGWGAILRTSSSPQTEPTVTLYRGSDTERAQKFITAKNNKDVLKNLTPAGGGDFHQRSATEKRGVFSPASYWTDDPRFAKTWAASKNTDDGGAVIEIQVPISFLYGTDTIEYPEPNHDFITV
ncbi:virulence plasmid 65kDa B protein-domain-containing protein [Sphaerosporella brunnea]|uniref:Virulence plasmid 65kDa B protein-domain-containing protein n=1 Tax=Sphaerosporella brunnea TaxID=1250544 RepID=A0A5J5EBI2_9PEZI|nr:virulence plasmid 65kDa B protein-domain-containing protein [Sphaerosporella brunnea]